MLRQRILCSFKVCGFTKLYPLPGSSVWASVKQQAVGDIEVPTSVRTCFGDGVYLVWWSVYVYSWWICEAFLRYTLFLEEVLEATEVYNGLLKVWLLLRWTVVKEVGILLGCTVHCLVEV